MIDIFSGDPRLVLTANGADMDYQAGQPVMDQGVENQFLLSLFTRSGWAGNIFLPPESQIGSDFEAEAESGGITMRKLNDLYDIASGALAQPVFGSVTLDITNPTGDHLSISAKLGPGQVMSISRLGSMWRNQASNPAYRRLSIK